jgi:ketosteroid isomerase-like protein
VTDDEHQRILNGWARVVREHDWDALGDYVQADAVLEYPQSGERFSGLANIRSQFENYPGLEPGTTELHDIIGGTTYALTPMYTVIAVEGSGNRGTAVMRIRYPDGSRWWALNTYELQDGKIARARSFFAPDFDPPDWRAPYRDEGAKA